MEGVGLDRLDRAGACARSFKPAKYFMKTMMTVVTQKKKDLAEFIREGQKPTVKHYECERAEFYEGFADLTNAFGGDAKRVMLADIVSIQIR